jgi:hypothetical protein
MALVAPCGNTLTAQADALIRYEAVPLACVSLHQSVSSDLETVHGDDRRTETTGWEGDLVVRAVADTGGVVSVTAWFERLQVWRDIPEARLEPATDGMLGGRYRGTLRPDGSYHAISTPFVPDVISAIAAMETALDELFPPLPTAPLVPGGTVTDGRGWGFDRLSDTVTVAGRAWRLRLLRNDTTGVSVDWGDGQFSEGESVEEERSRLLWQPGVGPLAWIRHITTVVTFSTTAISDRSVRTEVRQERRLDHLGVLAAERCTVP